MSRPKNKKNPTAIVHNFLRSNLFTERRPLTHGLRAAPEQLGLLPSWDSLFGLFSFVIISLSKRIRFYFKNQGANDNTLFFDVKSIGANENHSGLNVKGIGTHEKALV